MTYATNTDIMHSLDALRRDLQVQGADIKRLVDQHHDHERRIRELEPLRPQVERMTEHLSEIGGKVTVILERLDGTERGVAEALRTSARELAVQLAATVRAEMAGVREDLREMRDTLRERPCLVGESCPVHGGEAK